MRVRRYVGKDKKEVLEKIKNDMGNSAIILNTRNIRQKGMFSVFKKSYIEMTAIEDKLDINNNKNNNQNAEVNHEKLSKIEQGILEVNEKMERIIKTNITTIDEYKKIYNSNLAEILNILKANGINEEHIKEIGDEAERIINAKNIIPTVVVSQLLRKIINEPYKIKLEKGRRRIIILAGPTGVGKTTTLAKLAAIFSLRYDMNVGLITEDTYRIAAAEQLKTYAEILGIPLRVIYSPEEVTEALNLYSEKDVVFIDTAGKSPNDQSDKEILTQLINLSGSKEVFLVISSTTDYKNCKKIIDKYNFLNDYKLIFTKLDETENMGIVFDVCKISGKSISYFTIGQNVPDDIELADPHKIVNKLMGRVNV